MKISDLPDDLESEILYRVPAKSLAKLQTTCKRWYALFRDQTFVEKNKKLGKAELMLLINLSVYSIDNDLQELHKNVSVELTSLKDPKDLQIYSIFHCDGLILSYTEGHFPRLVVWNPCTGQTRQIKLRTCYHWEDTYALGYVVNRKSSFSSHSYKILRRVYYRNQEVTIAESEIYDLSSDSWRVLDYSTRDYDKCSDGMSLKGNTYWVARNKEMGFFMMTFDFKTERFVRLPLPLPFQSYDPDGPVALLVVRDEKLSVLHHDFGSVMRIWVTNKIDEEAKDFSWRNDFVLLVGFDILNLNRMFDVACVLLDEENKLAVYCDVDWPEDEYRIRIYILGEDMYKQVHTQITELSLYNLPHVLTYVPSLVHIPHPERYTHHKGERKEKEKEVS